MLNCLKIQNLRLTGCLRPADNLVLAGKYVEFSDVTQQINAISVSIKMSADISNAIKTSYVTRRTQTEPQLHIC